MGILLCGCCFSNLTAKTNEILLIIADIISLFLFSLCFFIINWKEISIINLSLFILMLVLVIVCLILTFFLRCWRSSGVIKTVKREKGITIANADFALTIINLIACVIEEIVIMVSFNKRIIECDDDDDEDYINYFRILSQNNLNSIACSKENIKVKKEYYIAYLTLSYMELILILSICILSILKRRIINKVDDDIRVISPIGHFGREVVVVSPGQVIGMQNYNYYSQNMNFGHSNNYQKQYINPQQVNVTPHNSKTNQINNSLNIRDKSSVYSSSSRNSYV